MAIKTNGFKHNQSLTICSKLRQFCLVLLKLFAWKRFVVVVVYKQTAVDCHLMRPQPQSSAAASYSAAKLSAVATLLG